MSETVQTAIAYAISTGEKQSFLDKFDCHSTLPEFLQSSTTGFPPILQSSFQVNRDSPDWEMISAFERVSIELRQRVFRGDDSSSNTPLAEITGKDLREIIIAAVEHHRAALASGTVSNDLECHFEGLVIRESLNLSGIDLPCSLRLINCHIEGCLMLARASLTTLDLSGSIIEKGVSAPHVLTRGAVRLRRTVISGIIDFGAAEVRGPLDAADSICVPSHLPPEGVVWVSDRSVVNFGLAQIGKEMRLNRVRWFGGLNMRSIHVSGSLFLTDAIIRSPIAVVEKLVVDCAGEGGGEFLSYQRSAAAAEKDLAMLLHRNSAAAGNAVETEALSNLSLPGCPSVDSPCDQDAFSTSLLGRLLFESAAVQSSAIRADGAVIDGVFSAESMRIGGRVRLKKITIKSALTFSGGHFRTFRSLRNTLAKIDKYCPDEEHRHIRQFCKYIIERLDEVDERAPNSRRQYAIDLRRANIGASVEFRKDSRKLHDRFGDQKIAQQIARTLCATNEDPVKFLQAFFGRPGELHRFLDNEDNRGKTEYRSFRIARHAMQGIGRAIDKQAYAVLDFERKNPIVDDDTEREKFPPARIPEPMTSDQKDLVAEVCGGLGRIKSTLLIGEISLSGAQIGGSLSFLGFMANIFDEPQRSQRPTILLDNARIRDNLDIRDSVGVQAISAEHAKIGGSVRMANDPVFILEHDRFGPARRRALYVAIPEELKRGAHSAYPKFNFERAEIGGDATFVFDHRYGPTLDMPFIRVAGKLTILPAIGGIELSKNELTDETFAAEAVRNGASITAGKVMRWLLGRLAGATNQLFPSEPLQVYSDRTQHIYFSSKAAKASLRTFKPYIDMRSATATVLAHPASAWPQQDSLLIEGMRYERTKDFGPLLARRRTWREVETQARSNVFWIASTLFVASVASFAVPYLAGFAAGEVFDLRQFSVGNDNDQRNYAVFGPWNVRFAQLVIGLSIWILLMKYFTQPRASDSLPMAVRYLRRQRRKFNVKRVASAIHAYDPYIHAAKILRADGHLLSADRVELERLRMRRRALSWRTSAPLRLILLFTDLIMQYGFAPVRIIALTTFFLISGSLLTTAAKNGEIVSRTTSISMPQDGPRLGKMNPRRNGNGGVINDGGRSQGQASPRDGVGALQPTLPLPPFLLRDVDQRDGGIDQAADQNIATGLKAKEMIPPVYVLDVMVPFLDLGQESSFDFFQRDNPSKYGMRPEFAAHFWIVPFLLKIVGWFLTSIIAVAIAARLETIMARNEDA